MASAAVVTAVRTYLPTVWTATPIKWPNEDFETEADGSAYLAVEFPVADEEITTVGSPGNNRHRETGVIRLVYAVPQGERLDDYIADFDVLRQAFRQKKDVIAEWLWTQTVSPVAIRPPSSDGNYCILSSAVIYKYGFRG